MLSFLLVYACTFFKQVDELLLSRSHHRRASSVPQPVIWPLCHRSCEEVGGIRMSAPQIPRSRAAPALSFLIAGEGDLLQSAGVEAF